MHEHLEPYGVPYGNRYKKLGKLSQEKQNANPNIKVGGKFLERAGEEMREEIEKRLANVVAKRIESISNDGGEE